MMMDLKKEGSAYRAFRTCAYRNKYETALIFGGKSFTYGQLLARMEQAYNTFRQMGVEPEERICLWMPNCPDLICAFYALSRLGAVGVLAHPKANPAEITRQMKETSAARLITTPQNYEAFCRFAEPLHVGKVILCRPWQDMKRRVSRQFLKKNPVPDRFYDMDFFDEQMEKNRYHAGDSAYLEEEQLAVILFGSSSFLKARPVLYLPMELAEILGEFYKEYEGAKTVYIEHSLAFEGGFLAAHTALCTGKTILFGENPMALLKKNRPDLVVGTEELFWLLRRRAEEFCGRWKNLRGGIQMGKEISALMGKYAPRSFEKMGGTGLLSGCPCNLKILKEPLCFIGDFGVRLEDVEAAVASFKGVKKCRCLPYQGGYLLQVALSVKGDQEVGAALIRRCRRKLGALHLPKKLEFIV